MLDTLLCCDLYLTLVMMAAELGVSVFTKLAGVPSLSGARIIPGGEKQPTEIEARWSQRELVRGKNIVFSKSYFVGEGLSLLCSTAHQSITSSVSKVAYSSDCNRKVVLTKDKPVSADSSSEPLQYIEVWNKDVLLKTIDVKNLEKHGKIHEDEHFGSFQLSSDGLQLLYIAEKEKPKTESYFKKDTKSTTDQPTVEKGLEYVYDTNWGEQLSSVVNPVPMVMNLETEECTIVDLTDIGDISAGQAQWVPGDEGGIVFVGYENHPRKLGFLFCFNKRSALYYANVATETCKRLTVNDHNHFSPRFNPQGTKLAFFETPAEGPHRPCAKLSILNWSDKSVSTVIDVVDTPTPPLNFPGFYTSALPSRCWDTSGRVIILSSHWGSIMDVTLVHTESSKVTRVVDGSRRGTWTVLDVTSDLVVAQFANPCTAPQLLVGALKGAEDDLKIDWTLIASPSDLTKDLNWELLTFTPSVGDKSIPYEGILLSLPRPPGGAPPPLAVFPHGGPHGVYTADFLLWHTGLALLGYTVLLVNYRGSCGFGQKNIDSLLGHVGTYDVRDVQDAAEEVVGRGLVDPQRVVVLGGSHGGFLTNHLLGQYPDFYKAGCALNPVTCFPLNMLTSDIPDWCCVEAGLTFDPATPPTAEDFAQMMSVSPISLAPKIKAPLLFAVGGKDLRCPPPQSFSVYNILKALGKETKLLYYPEDCHPIKTLPSNSDAFINTVVWFDKFAPPKN
ncbi:acylamino-acid-releasing enzyme-like isoform X2 [Halichondria panicea]|uniref:acylamino-acid-releasing enzyme-like isoform X2 n=1 Tax=Halichondria panicea TaxID=6063 RepID=UPI00312B782B